MTDITKSVEWLSELIDAPLDIVDILSTVNVFEFAKHLNALLSAYAEQREALPDPSELEDAADLVMNQNGYLGQQLGGFRVDGVGHGVDSRVSVLGRGRGQLGDGFVDLGGKGGVGRGQTVGSFGHVFDPEVESVC